MWSQSSKDIKRKIAEFLDDRDILRYCQIDREQHDNVCNEQFFHNILLQRYPKTLARKSTTTKHKKYYMLIVYFVNKLKEKYGFEYSEYPSYNIFLQHEVFNNSLNPKNMNDVLLTAVRHEELSLVKYALDKGANIHFRNDEALIRASGYRNLKIIKYLIEHGADIHAQNDLAFVHACSCSERDLNVNTIEYLVEKGANFRVSDDWALRMAIRYKHRYLAKYLTSLYLK